MKLSAIILSTIIFSTSVFATTFTKTESGSVSWVVNINEKKGTVKLNSDTTGYHIQDNASTADQIIISKLPLVLNRSFEKSIDFQLTDERSQESVQELITSTMLGDLKGKPVRTLDSSVVLTNVFCMEITFIRKQLVCNSNFVGEISLELLK